MSEKNIWSTTDETKLLKLLSDDIPLEKIIKKLKKKEKDIKYKLKKIALRMTNDKKTKDDIKKTLKFLTDEQITKIINHVNNKNLNNINVKDFNDLSDFGIKKKSKKNNNNSNDSNKIILMLTEINDKLTFFINNNTTVNKSLNREKLKLQISNICNGSLLSYDSSAKNNEFIGSLQKNNIIAKLPINNSYVSNSSSSGEDTDDIINMINKNKGVGRS